MDRETFAKTIKQKYPQYESMDNEQLVDKIITKYPTYKNQIKEPSFAERQGEVAQKSADTLSSAISGTGEFEDASLLRRGTGGVAGVATAISGTAYEALPEGIRNTLDKVGGGIGKGFEFVTDKISDSKFLQEAMSGDPANTKRLEDALQIASDLGMIAGEVAGIAETAATANAIQKAGVTGAKNIGTAVVKKVDDVATTTKQAFNDTLGKVEVPETIVNKEVFSDAVARGYEPQKARVFSELSDVDKTTAKRMFELAEDVDTGKSSLGGERPIDVVGNALQNDFKEVNKIKSTLGKQVDDVAQSLRGEVIDTAELSNNIGRTLDEFKINTFIDENGKLDIDFSDSDFALSDTAQRELKKAIEFVSSPKKDAYSVHRIKKTLDTLIKGSKQGEGITGQAKRLIEQLRRDSDDFLDTNFESYNQANSSFKEAADIVTEFEKTFRNTTDTQVAQKLRQIYSNSGKRGELKNAVSRVQDYLKSKGLTDRPNVYNLTEMAERIEDIYGTQAITGLKGQTERAITGAKAVAEGIRDPIKGVGSVAGNIVERVAKQRPQDRVDFIKKVLQTKNTQ